jgi:hypothetical protein
VIGRAAITIIALFVVAYRVMRRRRAREARPAVVAAPVRAVCDAKWCRNQPSLDSAALIDALQKVRSSITHTGAVAVRAELDRLQRLAEESPEGVPGHIVADARVTIDALMRSNLQ